MERLRVLSDEVDATSSLFRHGFAILNSYKFSVTDADPLFVCLANGCEKLLKLSLGLNAWEITGQWPASRVMCAYGHQITVLDDRVRSLIVDQLPNSTAPGHLQQLLGVLAQDRYVHQVLTTLERYAVQGRFYNLDYLGERPQVESSPSQQWDQLQQQLLEDWPDLRSRLASPDWEGARREINRTIEGSIRLWCELIARSWMTGVFGQQAKQWSHQLGLHQSYKWRRA